MFFITLETSEILAPIVSMSGDRLQDPPLISRQNPGIYTETPNVFFVALTPCD